MWSFHSQAWAFGFFFHLADSASGRNASLHHLSATMFEQVEIIAAQTPDPPGGGAGTYR